jgi:hypothetical protein
MQTEKGMKCIRVGLLLICGCISVMLSGCSSDPVKVAMMQQEKSTANNSVTFNPRNPTFKLVVDQDDRVANICSMSQQCEGLTNDAILMSEDNIGLGYYSAKIDCGHGFVAGQSGFGDFRQNRECDSRFYSTSSLFLVQRIGFGVLTYGLWTVMMWTAHEKSFDIDALREVSLNARLPELKKLLFSPETKLNRGDSISVLYLDLDDLDAAYQKIIHSPMNEDSVVLIDEDSLKPLYVLNMKAYQNRELPVAVNAEILDMLSVLQSRGMPNQVANDPVIQNLTPPTIVQPIHQSLPLFKKGEFETLSDFNERVAKTSAEINEANDQLDQQYKRDVEKQKQYVSALKKSLQEYWDDRAEEQTDLIRKLKKHKAKLARLLYALNLGKFTARDMEYDVEHRSLYFMAESSRYGFIQKMVAKVPTDSAKLMKGEAQYELMPKLSERDGLVKLEGLTLVETQSGDDFDAHYTDINYTPDEVSVRVAERSEPIKQGVAEIFNVHVNPPQVIEDTHVKAVLYTDVIKHTNAKAPAWYVNPEPSAYVRGFGEGTTHEQAMQDALKNLAYSIKTTITSSIEIQQDTQLGNHPVVTEHTKAETDADLNKVDPSVKTIMHRV